MMDMENTDFHTLNVQRTGKVVLNKDLIRLMGVAPKTLLRFQLLEDVAVLYPAPDGDLETPERATRLLFNPESFSHTIHSKHLIRSLLGRSRAYLLDTNVGLKIQLLALLRGSTATDWELLILKNKNVKYFKKMTEDQRSEYHNIKKRLNYYSRLFVDLDGTLIQTASGKQFPTHTMDFVLRDRVVEHLRKIDSDKSDIVIVTNQGGIDAGHITKVDFEKRLSAVIEKLNNAGVKVSRHYYCPSYLEYHANRKPNPGMILKDLREYPDPVGSHVVIGDADGYQGAFSDSDAELAKNLKCDFLPTRILDESF